MHPGAATDPPPAPAALPGLSFPPVRPVAAACPGAADTSPWGRLADLSTRLTAILSMDRLRRHAQVQPQLLVFAADHGIADEGVSRFGQEATRHRVNALLAGESPVYRMASGLGIAMTVVDAGVAVPLTPVNGQPGLVTLLPRKIGYGTRNMVLRPAMSVEQGVAALRAGMDVVRSLPGDTVLIGEAGAASTASAILLLSRLCGVPLADACGQHPDLSEAMTRHKLEKLYAVASRHRKAVTPFDALVAMGGFDLAMMTGAMIQAASEGRLVVVDGFVASAAALVARGLVPATADYLVFAHLSAHPGHRLLMIHMQDRPLLDMELRIGQGAGALLAWPLIRSALELKL